jgi:hypothetical protein
MYFAKTNISSGRGKKGLGFVTNQRIPDDAFKPEEFARLVKCGSVLLVDRESVTEPVVPSKEVRQATSVLNQGLWTFSAGDLADLTIDQLNMMIAQHVDKHGLAAVEPFGDTEEAVFFMTSETQPEE